jgi:hypothetical protein
MTEMERRLAYRQPHLSGPDAQIATFISVEEAQVRYTAAIRNTAMAATGRNNFHVLPDDQPWKGRFGRFRCRTRMNCAVRFPMAGLSPMVPARLRVNGVNGLAVPCSRRRPSVLDDYFTEQYSDDRTATTSASGPTIPISADLRTRTAPIATGISKQ